MNTKRNQTRGVLVIYTGGTIGSLPKDRADPLSPLEPTPDVNDVLELLSAYDPQDGKLTLGNAKVKLGTYSFNPPFDSSNIGFGDWVWMAEVIKDSYGQYEGFVVLHGTDTLAYTSSALAFMLENLSKPVIVTGSQTPIGEPRSDAIQNLITSIEIAAAKSLGRTVVPEVCVFFRDKLLRGCRTTKLSANSYDAFDSPNFPSLGHVGEHVLIDDGLIREASTQRLHVNKVAKPRVASLDVFPGMEPDLLGSIFSLPGLRGVVLQTFGAGNAPSSSDFLEVIERAVNDEKIILNVTQCRQGEVELGLCDVSAGLLARGVVTGMDMTPEAALTKLFLILGEEADIEVASDKVQLNLRGEQKRSIFNLHFPEAGFDESEKRDKVEMPSAMTRVLSVRREMVGGQGRYAAEKVEAALLRITGLEIPGGTYEMGIIRFSVFIDAPQANAATPLEGPHFLADVQKTWEKGKGEPSVVVPITQQVKDFVDNRHENTLTIVNTCGLPFRWRRANIACCADC